MTSTPTATADSSDAFKYFMIGVGIGVGVGVVAGIAIWFFNQLSREDERVEIEKKEPEGEKPVFEVKAEAVKDASPSNAEAVPVSATALAVSPTPVAEPIEIVQSLEDSLLVNFKGENISLTGYQAIPFRRIYEALKNGILEVHEKELLKGVGSANKKRLRDTFKSNLKAFYTMFAPGERRGTFRLKVV
jgi:hypothetical protein